MGREAPKFLGDFVWKITVLRQKNHIFSNFRGAPPPPPGSAPGYDLLFRPEFFFRITRVWFILLRKARIFFSEFNIRLYDKNSESYYFFFPPPKSEYFFQQHWESEYFFRNKHTPPLPLQVKWSFPYTLAWGRSVVFSWHSWHQK